LKEVCVGEISGSARKRAPIEIAHRNWKTSLFMNFVGRARVAVRW
jgi:hypothetical protein